MEAEKKYPKEKKVDVTITMSPYLLRKVDQCVSENGFSSRSDFVTHASTLFLEKFPDRVV